MDKKLEHLIEQRDAAQRFVASYEIELGREVLASKPDESNIEYWFGKVKAMRTYLESIEEQIRVHKYG